jgi:hypothetical protein
VFDLNKYKPGLAKVDDHIGLRKGILVFFEAGAQTAQLFSNLRPTSSIVDRSPPHKRSVGAMVKVSSEIILAPRMAESSWPERNK